MPHLEAREALRLPTSLPRDFPRARGRPVPSHGALRARVRALPAAASAGVAGCRVVHYSIQGNHVHMLVEAAGPEALGRGMKSRGRPAGPGGQPGVLTEGAGADGPVSRSGAEDASGGAKRAGLRAAECTPACGATGEEGGSSGCRFIGALVRGVEKEDRARPRCSGRGAGSHLARPEGLAAAWADRPGRDSSQLLSVRLPRAHPWLHECGPSGEAALRSASSPRFSRSDQG